MKTLVIILSILFAVSFRQSSDRPIPSVDVKAMDGSTFNTAKISNNGKPIIISLWATWCKTCVGEYNEIAENYEDWQKETGVKLVAISVDDTRTTSQVAPMVKTKGWPFEFYLDKNQDFMRAISVSNCPQTFLVDGKGNIVWQKAGYMAGQENEVYELVKKLAKGESINGK